MVQHSIWADTTPPGTYSLGADGSPSIKTANVFYQTLAGPDGATCVGAKLWCPVGVAMPAQVTLMAWVGPVNTDLLGTVLTDTPLRSATIDTVSGGWAVASWTPFNMPAKGVGIVIGAQYPGADNVKYLYGANARPDGSFVPALDDWPMVWCEHNPNVGTSGYSGTYYKIGSSAPSFPDLKGSYALDILVEDGVGGEEPPDSEYGIYYSDGETWHLIEGNLL